jgi:hypothetical protein
MTIQQLVRFAAPRINTATQSMNAQTDQCAPHRSRRFGQRGVCLFWVLARQSGLPWASADATPLYVIAHADYWRATGDRDSATLTINASRHGALGYLTELLSGDFKGQ